MFFKQGKKMFNTVHDFLHKKLISINLRKKAQITKIVGYKPQERNKFWGNPLAAIGLDKS